MSLSLPQSRSPVPQDRRPRADADPVGSLPLLASTHFCLDVLLRGPVLDLGSVVEVLRFDPCALLRLFGAAAEHGGSPDEAPRRLDECVLALGTAGLIQALRPAASSWQQQASLNRFAEHAAAVGTYARELAAALPLCGETAFNAGLLHAIGTLPAELGRTAWPATLAAACHQARQIAERYQLPDSLRRAVLSQYDPQAGEAWPSLLEAAHELADSAEAYQPVTDRADGSRPGRLFSYFSRSEQER